MVEKTVTDFAHKGYSRLIMVEGQDDGSFIYALLEELNLKDKIYLHAVGGKEKFTSNLIALLLSAEYENLSHLAIIRDADYKTDASASIQKSLENANLRNERRQFPIPDKAGKYIGSELKLGFFVLPQSGVEGILENLLIDSLADDKIMSCVDAYIQCLKEAEINLKTQLIPKAKIRIFLAGNAVDEKSSHEDSKIWELQYLFGLERWNWNHPAFDSIKTFLRQLAE
jgi:hypothetical protein